jgi:hypothetical protein
MFGFGPFELVILIGGVSVVAGGLGLIVFSPNNRQR